MRIVIWLFLLIFFSFYGIPCGPYNNWHYLGHVEHVSDDDDDDDDDGGGGGGDYAINCECCSVATERVVATVACSYSESTRSDRAPVHQRRRRPASRRCASRAATRTPTATTTETTVDDDDVVTTRNLCTCSSAAPTAVDGRASDPRTFSTVS